MNFLVLLSLISFASIGKFNEKLLSLIKNHIVSNDFKS